MSCIFNIYHISHTYFSFFSVTYGFLKLMPQNQSFREVLFVPRLLNDCSGFRNLWRNISRQKSRRRAAPRLMTWFLSGASRLGHRFRTHHIYKNVSDKKGSTCVQDTPYIKKMLLTKRVQCVAHIGCLFLSDLVPHSQKLFIP